MSTDRTVTYPADAMQRVADRLCDADWNLPQDAALVIIDHGARPTPAMLRTLADLAEVLPEDVTLTVCRDWEGCPVGILDQGDAEIASRYGVGDVLAFTTEGRIGSGGINQPVYFDSVAQYVARNLRRALAR